MIAEYYQKYDAQKGTQFVFSDLGTYQPVSYTHLKLLKGFKSKQGKNFDAIVAFDGEYNTTFVFAEKKCKSSYPKKRK